MRFTPSQGLPYPASRREAANAPLASELLARAADAKLAALNTAWAAEVVGPTAILTLSSNITGIPANTDWPVLTTTVQKSVPAGVTFNNQAIYAPSPGWYHCFCNVHVSCEGAANAATRRILHADIYGSPDPISAATTITERFTDLDYDRNGSVGLEVEFVTFLRPSTTVALNFFHANTSSTMRVDSNLTQLSFTKICGEV